MRWVAMIACSTVCVLPVVAEPLDLQVERTDLWGIQAADASTLSRGSDAETVTVALLHYVYPEDERVAVWFEQTGLSIGVDWLWPTCVDSRARRREQGGA